MPPAAPVLPLAASSLAAAVPSLLAGLGCVALGLLARRRERSAAASAFLVVSTVAGVWLIAFAGMYRAADPARALLLARLGSVAVAIIPAAVYTFAVTVVGIRERRAAALVLAWAVALFMAFEMASGTLVFDAVRRLPFGFYPAYRPTSAYFLAYFVALLLAAEGEYVRQLRRLAAGAERARIAGLLLAFAVAYLAALDFLPSFGLRVYPLGFVPISVFLLLTLRTIQRYRLVALTPALAATEILATMAEALLVCDRDGRVQVANAAAEALVGETDDALRGRSLASLLADEDAARALLEQGEVVRDREIDWRTRRGDRVAVALSSSPLVDGHGARVGTVVVARDVRAQKAALARLQASEERYRRLVELSPEAIAIHDGEAYLYLNPQGRALLGLDAEAPLGHLPLLRLWAPASHDEVKAGARCALGGQEVRFRELELVTRDGRVLRVEAAASPTRLAGTPAVQEVIRDLTQRLESERKSREQVARLAALRSIDLAITSGLDLRVTLDLLLERMTTLLGVDAATVLLLDPATQRLRFAAERGIRSAELRHVDLRLGESHAGRIAVSRQPEILADLRDATGDLRRAPLLLRESFVSYAGVPLIAKGQVKGVVEVFHGRPLQPTADWLEFLDMLAGQAAIAIDSAQMFESLQRSNAELAVAYDATIEGWARALELRDEATEGHTRRVTELTLRVARAMGIDEVELIHVRRGALLHDIGKLAIPDRILLKPGPLDEAEWEVMRLHPVYAFRMLAPIPYLRPALDIPYCHHEHWDGSGYPRGLREELIPLAARIFAVVDNWDALISDRPYRRGWPHEQAREYLRARAGTQFDPAAVEATLRVLDEDEEPRLRLIVSPVV